MATIQGIYVALFGRPADPAGLAYFNGVTNNGADLSAIGNLAGQKEYTDRFAGMDNTQIVNSIYQSLFGRDGESSGVAFWTAKLASGALTINNIAIAILDGAQGADKAAVDAKIAAADLMTSHMDLPVEQQAYKGAANITIAHNYLSAVDATHPGTGAAADAAILLMLQNAGQAPADQGGGDTTTGTPAAFSVAIDGTGHLVFGGLSGNSVSVTAAEDGHLVFKNGGQTATLSNMSTDIVGVQHGISLVSENSDSHVLARDTEGGWHFVDNQINLGDETSLNLDIVDFYTAVGSHSSVLLTSDFDTTVTPDDLAVIANHQEYFQQLLSGIISNPLGAIDTVSSHLNISVAAGDGANTSLNHTIGNIVDLVSSEANIDLSTITNAINFNIGLPVLLSGEGANSISADSETGFTLIGNWNSVASHFGLGSNALPVEASNDTLKGGSGDDILIGLDDQGTFHYNAMALKSLATPSVMIQPEFTFTAGDTLTGGGGNNIFVHIEISDQYSDGVDLITDYHDGDKIAIISNLNFTTSQVDINHDGVTDTLITFGWGMENAAIGVLGTDHVDIVDVLGVNNTPQIPVTA